MTRQARPHRTLYDTPGAPGPTPHCPTCGRLLTCKVCGFTQGPCEAGVAEVGAHRYEDGVTG